MTKQKKQTQNQKDDHLQDDAQGMESSVSQSEQKSTSSPDGGAASAEVGNSMDEYDEYTKNYNEIKKQLDESTDGWQRERADFLNYKKRIDRERDLQRSVVTGDLCKKFLVVLDDLERAMKNRPQDGDGANWADGIDLIMRKMQGILEMENIQRIPAEIELFDPNRHEAVSSEASDAHESGAIIEVLQQGYLIGDRVLRPALVRVAQ
jgi:molecular chaperone GrpE